MKKNLETIVFYQSQYVVYSAENRRVESDRDERGADYMYFCRGLSRRENKNKYNVQVFHENSYAAFNNVEVIEAEMKGFALNRLVFKRGTVRITVLLRESGIDVII